jgi:hypothetical protein
MNIASLRIRVMFLALSLLLLTLLSSGPIFAQITPSADAYTNTSEPKANHGTESQLMVNGASHVSYIQFNLASIPPNAIVSQATLKLFANSVATGGSFNVYYVNGLWSESTITGELAPALGKMIAANVAVNSEDKNQYILINVTSALESWLSGTELNNGIALVANGVFSANFDSKENAATGHAPEIDVVLANAGTLQSDGSNLVCVQLSALANPAAGGAKGQGSPGAASANIGIKCGGGGGGYSPITGVTAGLGLSGGGTSGNVTLSINASVVPQLKAENTFTGNQTVAGNVIISGSGNGVQFPDGTVQTTGMTSGLGVIGTSPVPPAGYSVVNGYTAGNNWVSSGLAGMPTPRVGMAAVSLNGLIYVIGGNGASTGNPTATVEAYNPVSNTWTSLAPMNTARLLPAAVALNGLIYVIGGGSVSIAPPTTGAVEVYNPGTNTWTVLNSMPTPRYALGAVVVNGLIYAIGGSELCNTSIGTLPTNTVEIYDPTTNTWSEGTPMPNGNLESLTTCPSAPFAFTSGLSGIAASLINGEIYVTGATGTGYQITNGETYAFDPNSKTWTTLAIRSGSQALGLTEAVLNGNIYTLDSNGGVQIYNLAANTWSSGVGSGLYTPGGLGPVLSSANGLLYGVGINSQSVSTTEQYWPATTLYVYIKN